MKATISLLAVLLVAQVALAIGLNYQDAGLSKGTPQVAMLTLEKDGIARVRIEGAEDREVVLARGEEGWQLPKLDGFPANTAKVDTLLGELLALKQGLPVATSDAALTRFKLTEENFERRITLSEGEETLATLYLGTSQGTRQVHARREGQDEVYAVSFATYEAPADADDWLDKTVIQVPEQEIAALEVNGLRLTANTTEAAESGNSDGAQESAEVTDAPKIKWTLERGGEDGKLNTDAAQKLAGLLADLRILSVRGTENTEAYGLDTPALALTLERRDGPAVDYRLGKEAEKDVYTLKLSSRPEYLRVPSATAKQLIETATAETLVSTPAESSEKDQPEAAQEAETASDMESAPQKQP